MKSTLLLFFLSMSAIVSAASFRITVSNPNPSALKDAPVVVKLDQYTKIPASKRSQLAVFENGKQISSQLDDLTMDGIADELVFLTDLNAGESKKIVIKTISDKKRNEFPAEVYVSLLKKEANGSHTFVTEASSTKNDMYNALHHHGVAFESELMAYRIYFDNKSTIDVYGKKKRQLEIAQTGWYPSAEQLAAGFGDDILLVSSWVGVGTVKGWDGTKATHIDKFDRRTQRIVATGNLRTVAESEVLGWDYEGKKIDMTVRYIMYARHRDAVVEIRATENINHLATGVQQIGGGSLHSTNELVGSWGSHYPQPDTVKYAKETAGLGVHVPRVYNGKHVMDGVNNLILMPYKKGEVLRFYMTCVAAKEENNSITSDNKFFAYLKEWSGALLPVIVK